MLVKDPLTGAPQAPAGTPQAATRQQVSQVTAAIFRDDIAQSFKWPFYVAALAALLAIFPALLTGRRLGEHAGHEKLDEAGREAAGEARRPAGPRRPARRPTPSSDRAARQARRRRQRCRRPAPGAHRPAARRERHARRHPRRRPHEFAEHGYDRATIRGIAARAGVDPALVHHYFGSKEQLFEAAVELPVSPADVSAAILAGERERIGEEVVRALSRGLGGAAQPADLHGDSALDA